MEEEIPYIRRELEQLNDKFDVLLDFVISKEKIEYVLVGKSRKSNDIEIFFSSIEEANEFLEFSKTKKGSFKKESCLADCYTAEVFVQIKGAPETRVLFNN